MHSLLNVSHFALAGKRASQRIEHTPDRGVHVQRAKAPGLRRGLSLALAVYGLSDALPHRSGAATADCELTRSFDRSIVIDSLMYCTLYVLYMFTVCRCWPCATRSSICLYV